MLKRRLAQTVTFPVGDLLDAGCGTGANLHLFHKLFPEARLTGLDASPLALKHISAPEAVTLRLGDVNRLDLPDLSFDVVFSGNVLGQQSASPPQAVAEFFRVLRPGGVVLLNLPALRCLRGEHDEAVNDARRFHAPEVRRLLLAAGFEEVRCHYWNCLLTPVLFLRRFWTRVRRRGSRPARSDLEVSGGWLTPALGLGMEVEVRTSSLCPLPFGSSLFATARKPIPFSNLPQTA